MSTNREKKLNSPRFSVVRSHIHKSFPDVSSALPLSLVGESLYLSSTLHGWLDIQSPQWKLQRSRSVLFPDLCIQQFRSFRCYKERNVLIFISSIAQIFLNSCNSDKIPVQYHYECERLSISRVMVH